MKIRLGNTRTIVALLLVMCVTVLLGACGATQAGDSDDLEELTVQFVPTRTGESMETQAKPLQDLLSEELGIPVTISVSTDYSTIVEAMVSKQIDVGIMPPNTYVVAHDQGAADAILQAQIPGVKQPGGVIDMDNLVDSFRAQIVVKADSGIETLEDLKGKTIAVQDFVSASGYVFPAAELKDHGIDIEQDANIVNIRGIDAATLAVLNDDADAAFLFEDGRNLVKNDVPDIFEKVEVLYFTEARIPNDAIAVRSDMNDEWRDKIKNAFIKVGESEEGREVVSTLFSHQGYVES